jgi:teichoic acid transport system permease protein
MVLIFVFMGYMPDIYIIQLPFYIVCMFIFFTIWGLFASLLGAISKDFANLVKAFVTAVFWLSGILWNANTITIPWVKKLLMVNPVTFLVNGFRNCLIDKIWFFEQPKELLCFGVMSILMLLLSIWAYKKLKKEIPDVL